jgi:VWFA-related protein
VALALLITSTSGVHVQSNDWQVPVFRAAIDLVNLGVTVTDRKGVLATDLTADDFDIYEDGKKQAVRYFAAGEASNADRPSPEMHLGLLLDVSQSMVEDIGFTRTAAIKFLNALRDAVDITLVDFDTEVRVARYGQREYARLIERIRNQKAIGWTALYDAIGVYLDGAAEQEGRTIMLLYTDGADTRSALGFGDLLALLRASDVTVYVIGQLEHQLPSVKETQRELLLRIAEVTGGQAFFPRFVKDLDEAYAKVLAEIRAQYTIGYLSTNGTADGRWRKVDVKVGRRNGREYRVRSRKGYFAPLGPVEKKP